MNSAVVAISSLIQGILPMLPELLQLGITLIAELANGIATQLPTLIPLAIECLLNLVTTFLDNIDFSKKRNPTDQEILILEENNNFSDGSYR